MRRRGRFGQVLARGRRLRGEVVELILARGSGIEAGIGVVVGRRVLPSAVSRNRARRILREVLRSHRPTLTSCFVIFRLRQAPSHPGMRDLRSEASQLLQRACEKCLDPT